MFNNSVILNDLEVRLGSELSAGQIITDDWTKYLPVNEMQASKYFDTWACVSYSACNCIEIYFKYLIDKDLISEENIQWLKDNYYWRNNEVNFSDRFIAKKSGTVVGAGNSGGRVKDAILECGLVPEDLWTMTADDKYVEDYYDEPPESLNKLGLEFLKRFNLKGEQIYISPERLKYSPMQVYVLAWYINESGLYYNPGTTINHAVTKVRTGLEQIFDQYNPYIKTLVADYYYHPTGYQYFVNEIIKNMNVEKFLKDNDLLFVRNIKTGEIGRIMQEVLMTIKTKDRGTLMLLDDQVRKNGRGITDSEWNTLPKKEF